MSFWGKLGKGLLKVGKVAAPIALGMTGVGLPAAMAVSGGLNALDKKVSGGSWKDALKSGAIGAGTAAAGAGMGKLGGWAGKFGSKVGKGADPTGVRGAVQGVADRVTQAGGRAMAPQQSAFQRIMGNIGQGARTAQDVMGAVGAARGAMGGGMGGYRTPPFNPNAGGYPGAQRRIPGRAMGQAVGRMDQRNPNLAYAIQRGRNEAMMNQPWRTPPINPDPTQQLPPIYPNMGGGGGIGPSYMPSY
jgi:hypothetical protein